MQQIRKYVQNSLATRLVLAPPPILPKYQVFKLLFYELSTSKKTQRSFKRKRNCEIPGSHCDVNEDSSVLRRALRRLVLVYKFGSGVVLRMLVIICGWKRPNNPQYLNLQGVVIRNAFSCCVFSTLTKLCNEVLLPELVQVNRISQTELVTWRIFLQQL